MIYNNMHYLVCTWLNSPRNFRVRCTSKNQTLGLICQVSSITIECVRFTVHSNDHLPCHIHGAIGGTLVIVDILPSGDVQLARRTKAIRPKNAKKSDIRQVLNIAAEHSKELRTLWEKVHGKA
jgi:Domain of unknown function (DUF4160)